MTDTQHRLLMAALVVLGLLGIVVSETVRESKREQRDARLLALEKEQRRIADQCSDVWAEHLREHQALWNGIEGLRPQPTVYTTKVKVPRQFRRMFDR